MNPKLLERIRSQDAWTFRECLGLASEFNLKTRMVIIMVMAQGKIYVDGDLGEDPSCQTESS